MLKIDKLTASYSGITALHGVSLTVSKGEMVALIGANGAGKSTLLNCISGIVPSDSGQILFNGQELSGRRPASIARMGLLQVPEGRQILSDLSVYENLQLGQLALGNRSPTWSHEQVVELFPVLGARQNQRAGSLSGGEQQMLAIGRGLMGAPELLLLDEPSLGLAPKIVDQVFSVLTRLNEAGLTILLVEQNARRALQIASRAYVLERGMVVHSGPADVVAADKKVVTYYLGNLADAASQDQPA
ncbi:ABC transporter ATP-binding protein [Chelativorans sp. Marseille-P2723]|uniref:ABC transporter ATP-binding protein n=1 Tax=Chelativorans sp. Marseille-P2723 TaxID=2709133 RepID=UPI00156E826E|nr:ABC transporter ATP-binding protein [Chelativorans sp. Marseille-P2723]